jgi:hypothetical protein
VADGGLRRCTAPRGKNARGRLHVAEYAHTRAMSFPARLRSLIKTPACCEPPGDWWSEGRGTFRVFLDRELDDHSGSPWHRLAVSGVRYCAVILIWSCKVIVVTTSSCWEQPDTCLGDLPWISHQMKPRVQVKQSKLISPLSPHLSPRIFHRRGSSSKPAWPPSQI